MSGYGDTIVQTLSEPEKTLATALIAADEAEGSEVDTEGLSQDEKKEVISAAAEQGLAQRAVAVTQAIEEYIEAKFTQHANDSHS